MQPRNNAEIERSVLSFLRRKVDEEVHVAFVGLSRGQSSSFHRHSVTSDTFYVTSGKLTVTMHVDPARGAEPYRSLSATKPAVHRLANGREVHKAHVLPGEVLVVLPEVVHCASNVDDEPCRFLCIEGVGVYDFVSVDP